jgi:O-antigen/teichoic acid export membrane protein
MWSLAGQVAAAAAAFVATPVVIRRLGADAYGVLALVNLVTGYLAFADAGMGEASTRFAAVQHERADARAEAGVVWATLAIAMVPTISGAIALVLAAPLLATRAFHLPPSLIGPGVLALRIAALAFAARSLAGVLNTPQLVRLRFDSLTLINAGFNVAQILLVPIVLWAGGGLVDAVCVIAGAAAAGVVAHAIMAWRLLPEMSRPSFQRDVSTAVMWFGAAVAASGLMNIALGSGERVMLTTFTSVRSLAYYSVAMTLAGVIAMVPSAIGQALSPAFARLGALADRRPLQQLYARALLATVVVSLPGMIALCFVARPFFAWWAGPEFGIESSGPFYVLAGGVLVNIVACIPYRMLLAQGRANFLARYHGWELAPYLVVAGLLTFRYGSVGAAAAWTLRQVIGAGVLLRAVGTMEGLGTRAVVQLLRHDGPLPEVAK